jgi:uncharacterized repeat protein (TIGR03843 family)
VSPTDAALAARLRGAELELLGRFADASNATLLVRLLDRDPPSLETLARRLGREPGLDDLDPVDLAVYKPVRGEAPLWDFPPRTLHLREVAAYELSVALGWDLVPITVLRDEGPLGSGSLQRFVPHDLEEHYFALLERDDPAIVAQLRAMVVFDLLANNADRKGGHVLLETTTGRDASVARVRLIDHGIAFHAEPKLRTVAWHFADEPTPASLRADVLRLCEQFDELTGPLVPLLAGDELAALRLRAARTAELEHLPRPTGPRSTPWPPL